ncbi:MAG: alpha/beta hydrolase family protein [Sphingobacteriales bacterium]|jgi:pimeloyl-ACP methyl ester carboxylesterase
MNVYLIPGLAADERVFRHIRLPEGYHPQILQWVRPEPKESLASYAMKLAEQIDRSAPFTLIGLSFGGMLATEIAKRLQPHKTVLISSVPHSSQLPSYYRWAWRIGVQYIMTPTVIKSGVMIKRLLTAEAPEDKKIIVEMARDMDPEFVRWAMWTIVHWKTTEGSVPGCMHIHGSADGILPCRFTRPSHLVPKAGHLMIFNQADRINALLAEILL